MKKNFKPRQPRYAQIYSENEVMAETATDSWQRAIAHLNDSGLLTASRVEIADRYARAYAEYEYLYPIAAADGPVTKGPNGGDVFNYAWSAVEKLNDRIAKFEAKLGIDVKDGESTGVKVSDVKSAADEFLD